MITVKKWPKNRTEGNQNQKVGGDPSKGLRFSPSWLEVSIEGQFVYFLASPEGNLRVLYFGTVSKTGEQQTKRLDIL